MNVIASLQVLQGKKGAGGIVVAKSNKAIVIGVYSAESGIQVRLLSYSLSAAAMLLG